MPFDKTRFFSIIISQRKR